MATSNRELLNQLKEVDARIQRLETSSAYDLAARTSAPLDDTMNQSQSKKFRGNSMRFETAPNMKKKANDPRCCAPLPEPKEVDVVLIGGGIMSATVGLMLKELEPDWKMVMFERLHAVGEESSNGFNNAGTGHAGFMEPNYTKEKFGKDGKLETVTTDKVIHVCEQFLASRQYWHFLVEKGDLPDPDCFIHQTNHIALGIGEDQCDFIEKRYEAMKKNPLFASMEIARPSERAKQSEWAPLITKGRKIDEPLCMTRVKHGTDVNFGALCKNKIKAFMKKGGDVRLFTEVTDVKKDGSGWMITTKTTSTGRGICRYKAKFVFVGAGGWALLMLQKAGIPAVNGYMALPVTGDWAVCQNPDVVKQHKVKVYAPGAPGAPPMSMPHLDYRTIDGKDVLLFGPFGSITFKFLRYGSITDALKALKPHNICPTIGALSRNLSLAVMLMKDVFKSGKGKLMDIRHYYPEAEAEDWTLIPAGVRAQIIKKDPTTGKGMLQFGTEVVTNGEEGTIVGLLGASPGASTCVTIALDTIEKCFGNKPEMKRWEGKIQKMIPNWRRGMKAGDLSLKGPSEIEEVFRKTGAMLKISVK